MAKQEQMLVGDIGGTNSRLRLFSIEFGTKMTGKKVPGTLLHANRYANENFNQFSDVVKAFYDECAAKLGQQPTPTVASLAVAGPVDCNMVAFTNRSAWVIDGHELERTLNIPSVRLVNDFVANGYGLLTLEDTEVHTLQNATPKRGSPIALIGAGTGLGECFLVASPDNPDLYDAWPAEGGHTEFAPRTDLEIELLKFLMHKFGEHSRVSVERICSGRGLSNVYEFLRQRFPQKVDPEIDAKWQAAGDQQGTVITNNANANVLCRWAMEIFFSTYGSEAGSVGLKYLCYGGLYIAGGIAPNNIDWMEKVSKYRHLNTGFLPAFHDKGRVSKVLKQIPLHIVKAEDIGQRGAHLLAFRALTRRWEHAQS